MKSLTSSFSISKQSKTSSTSYPHRSRRIKPEVGTLIAAKALLAVESFKGQVWDANHTDNGIMEACCSIGIASFCTSEDFFKHDFNMPHVITEPPPKLAEQYARRGLQVVTGKVALLVPVDFLTKPETKALFECTPLARVYMLTKKPVHRPKPMAWAVWERGNFDPPTIRFL